MSKPRNAQTLGERIYLKIDSNDYLQEIYSNILYNYSLKILSHPGPRKTINLDDTLTFADLLSNSTGTTNSEKHKIWAQEIIALLLALYPKNEKIEAYASAILSNISNYCGLEIISSEYKPSSFLDELYSKYDKDFLAIPYQNNKFFFHSQKKIYSHLEDQGFSYSGPTSMGKSLIMRMFIKDKILNHFKGNFAILVPTKALITEITSKLQSEDLKEELGNKNYKVVNSGNSIFLKQEGLNYIFVLTPERLLYLLISYPDLSINYLFIDEAHKISEVGGRSAFYYKVIDMLVDRPIQPHVILSSPNIPNPDVYLSIIPKRIEYKTNYIATSFSPVSQIKYYVNMIDKEMSIFNEHSRKFEHVVKISTVHSFADIIAKIIKKDLSKQNIIYDNSKEKVIQMARDYADTLEELHNLELDKLAKDIKDEIHDSYYLSDIIKKGVAYHIGYLPMHIRSKIEKLYRNHDIRTLFCTSTLIEGVNLPVDNLFILNYKNGLHKMSAVDFRNLIGRVGRIGYNLYGNVFVIRYDEKNQKEDKIKELLQEEVPHQQLSINAKLSDKEKNTIIDYLVDGNVEFPKLKKQTEDEYSLMRKIGLILLRDITSEKNSIVRSEFQPLLNNEITNKIKTNFTEATSQSPQPDDDINVSIDQSINLSEAIKGGLKYPVQINGRFDYESMVCFLKKLSKVFKWQIYDKNTLGNFNNIRWYAVILSQWMIGYGLKQVLQQSINHKVQNGGYVLINNKLTKFDNSAKHKNVVISEVLGIIENVILFSIANYFLRFSAEYKLQQTDGQPFENDWYEFVEYGSTNELTIFFQRNGFTRDTADYLREHKAEYVVRTEHGIKLKKSALQATKESVSEELEDIKYNVPELFID